MFHLPTLAAALALVSVAGFGFSIVLYATRQTFDGARLWILGQGLVAVGGIGLGLRWELPWVMAVMASNIPFLAAPLLFFHSLWVFRGLGRFPGWLYLVIPLEVVLYMADLSPDIRFRAIAFSVISGGFNLAACVVAIIRQPREYRLPAYLLGTTFLLTALGHLSRVPQFLVSAPLTFEEQGGVSELIMFLSILSAFLILFGYYLLSSVRFERERLEREEMLRDRNERLKRFNETTATLLSIIGHDVKAPLASASRFVSRFLVDAPESLEERKRALNTIDQTLRTSYQLLENLVLFARARLADRTPRFEDVSIANVIADSVSHTEADASAKGIHVDSGLEEGVVSVWSEEASLKIILRNVLSNAVKFSPPDSHIAIQAARRDGTIVLSVSDQGRGIPPQMLQAIRDNGSLVTTRGTAGERGHGIGLALVRALAAQLEIELSIESEIGLGTTVCLEFPERSATISDV